MNLMIKDSDGKKSLTTTLAVVTFVIVMLKVLLNGASISIGTFSYTFGTISSDEIAALLGTTLGTYAFRRHTERKFAARGGNESVEP